MPVLNQITAQLNTASLNYGKFEINMVGDDPATDFYVGITGPGAYEVKAYPASPDNNGSTFVTAISIPLDSNGNFLQGDYIFHLRADGTGGSGTDVEDTKTFCLSFVLKSVALSVVPDCYSKSLVITDETEYPTGTVVRAITVSTPTIAGEEDVADVVYSTEESIIDMVRSSGNAYSGVSYSISGEATVTTSEIEDDWEFGYELSYTGLTTTALIRCDTDACGIINCVNTTIQALISKACKVGGFAKLPTHEADKMVEIQTYLAMYNYYNQCRDNTNALIYYDLLKALTGDCDCGTDGVTVIADSTFTYIRGYSAYELWVQEGNTGTMDDFFSALFPITDWAEVDSSYYINNFLQYSADKLMYRLTKAHIEFKGSFKSDVGATSVSNPDDFLSASFDPIQVDAGGNATIRNGADHAGYLFRDDTDDKWKIRWNTNFARPDVQQIFGQIPIDGYLTSQIQLNALGWTEVPAGQYKNSHTSPTVAFSFKTDGKYIVFRGQILTAAHISSGLEVIDPTYWDSVGVAMEENAIVAAYNASTKILVGYMKVVNGTLKMFPITSPSVPTAGIELILEGIIPLQ